MPTRVSIIDDDGPTRSLLAELFRHAPAFHLAGDWADAETALDQLPGQKPNVVLVDIQLPAASGIQVVKRLKPIMPDTEFVMLTVYQDADRIFDALAAGATGYLLKNTPQEGILAAVRDAAEGGSPISSGIARKIFQFFLQPSPPGPSSEKLSGREEEILKLVAQGLFFKEISERLHIAVPTVKTHVRRIYVKLHVRSRTQAAAVYSQMRDPHLRPLAPSDTPGTVGDGS
jgi:DNA-binding NarL/FixJ family response regulator